MAYYDTQGRITNIAPQNQYQNPWQPTYKPPPQQPVTPAPNVGVPATGQAVTLPATAGTNMQAAATPAAFDWRQGAWQVANRWAPGWAMTNPWTTIQDPAALIKTMAAYIPDRSNTAAYAAYGNDIAYLKAAQANQGMPSWYGTAAPNNTTPTTPATQTPGVNYTPGAGVPTFDWSQYGGTTATSPISGYSGIPSWMNDPNWAKNNSKEAQAWAAVMVPWAQAQQNAYQYQNDANEAQRRYNLERAWTTAQDQFTMDQAQKTADYQKVRDQEEFALGRQQVWGRNQTPNTKWMRSWS